MNTKLFLFFLFLNLFSFKASAQFVIDWQKSLGGSDWDSAWDIHQTTDGGYIIAGNSASIDGDLTINYGGRDYWIVKLTNSGEISWQKSFGGSNSELALSIEQTADEGYIVAGQSSSVDGNVTGNNGGNDFWIVKLTNDGDIEWENSLGGSEFDSAYSIQQTIDSGYIIAGRSSSNDADVTGNHGNSDYWVVKLTNSGNIVWQKSIGGTGNDNATSIQQTSDGGYIVAGDSDSTDGDVTGNHGNSDYWIVKLTNSGNIEWQKSIGGTGNDNATSIQQTIDGGYIIAGDSDSTDGDVTGNHGNSDYWIVKLTNSGNIEWQNSYGGTSDDSADFIQQISDGGYIVTGDSSSADGDTTSNQGLSDVWILKLTNSGNIDWQKSIGGSDSEISKMIRQTNDGAYIALCRSRSLDGDVIGNHGNNDYWIVKLASETLSVNEFLTQKKINIFPNPTNGILNFDSQTTINKIQVYNSISEKIFSNYNSNTLDISKLQKGMYLIEIEDSLGNIAYRKIIKE